MSRTYHPLNPADVETMRTMRSMFAAQPRLSFGPETRQGFDDLMSRVPSSEGVRYEMAEVGGIPGWWCRPEDAPTDRAILFVHGGGYVLGSAAAFRPFAGQVAARAGAMVFVPDYRLAPEHPFPAAILDVQAAYRGLEACGVGAVALIGDSAGGGLVLALLQLETDVTPARRPPTCAVLLSPLTDLAFTGDSVAGRAHADPLLAAEAGPRIAGLYLKGQDPRDPRASPLYGDLSDLPPVLIHVGEDEVLLDDSRRCADRIEEAGGEVELHVWEGMIHVFPSNIALLQSSRTAMDQIGAFLKRHVSG